MFILIKKKFTLLTLIFVEFLQLHFFYARDVQVSLPIIELFGILSSTEFG